MLSTFSLAGLSWVGDGPQSFCILLHFAFELAFHLFFQRLFLSKSPSEDASVVVRRLLASSARCSVSDLNMGL